MPVADPSLSPLRSAAEVETLRGDNLRRCRPLLLPLTTFADLEAEFVSYPQTTRSTSSGGYSTTRVVARRSRGVLRRWRGWRRGSAGSCGASSDKQCVTFSDSSWRVGAWRALRERGKGEKWACGDGERAPPCV